LVRSKTAFTADEEHELVEHVSRLEKLSGLTPVEFHRLAYDFAEAINIKKNLTRQKKKTR
jgi:hypothetical protein